MASTFQRHFTRVCSVSSLSMPFRVATFPLVGIQKGFVFRDSHNILRAYANVCVHRGLELDWDDDGDFFDDENHLRCKAHDAKFDPSTGLCVKGPRNCAGKKSLKALNVVVIDDYVCVRDVPDSMLDFRKDFPSLKSRDGREHDS